MKFVKISIDFASLPDAVEFATKEAKFKAYHPYVIMTNGNNRTVYYVGRPYMTKDDGLEIHDVTWKEICWHL